MLKTNLTKEQISSWIRRQWLAQQIILDKLEDEENYVWITNAHNSNCDVGVHVLYRDLLIMASVLEIENIGIEMRDGDEYDRRAYFIFENIKVFALTSAEEMNNVEEEE